MILNYMFFYVPRKVRFAFPLRPKLRVGDFQFSSWQCLSKLNIVYLAWKRSFAKIGKRYVRPATHHSLINNTTRWRNKIKSTNTDKKLHMSLIFSNLVAVNQLSLNHRMYNLYTKFVKILGICKQFSQNLVNECGNIPRRGPVPKFSDLEVVALSLTAEAESIDSEKWLFSYKLQERKSKFPNLISRRGCVKTPF